MALVKAVVALNEAEVRACLEKEPQIFQQSDAPRYVLHTLCACTPPDVITSSPGRRAIVYLLRNNGLDVNVQNQDGDTPLHLVLTKYGDTELCEALLQCGADMNLKNKIGLSSLDVVQTQSNIPDRTRELLLKYKPGLWRAVQDDDLMSVRKLINLWCRVDINKNGRSLKELALSKGTEHIIRLIKDIDVSMRLAHSAMAGDFQMAESLCNGNIALNLSFKNLGDMGATPLFYAIMHNNAALVELLCKHGAKIDSIITFEDNDIPLYVTALNKDIDPEIIKFLTPAPSATSKFSSMHYKGRTVLQYCIENDVSPSSVRHVLKLGYPDLIAARGTNSLCPREMAEQMGKLEYVKVIDEVVHDWYLDSDSKYRQFLALQGYPYMKQAQKDGVQVHEVILSMETSSEQAKFDCELETYQSHIAELHEAVEAGDASRVSSLLTYPSQRADCFVVCLANSRAKNDGQPLLHKAVLRQHTSIVELLAQACVNTLKLKLDAVVDPWYRTALHYAYAIPGGKDTVYVLQDYGCSDFTLDKDSRSPLVFRDYRQHAEMHQLINYHLNKAYVTEEPKPWKQLKIPLIGHGHSHLHSNMRLFAGHEVSQAPCPSATGSCDRSTQAPQSRQAEQIPMESNSREAEKEEEEYFDEYESDDECLIRKDVNESDESDEDEDEEEPYAEEDESDEEYLIEDNGSMRSCIIL